MKVKSQKDFTIAVIGSHSALDVCRGAKDEGFKTLVVVEKGRDKTYAKYFKTKGPSASSGRASLGCVDEVLYVDKFRDILSLKIQNELKGRNCIFIPHRSFEVYVNDYDAIENKFNIPVFGNKKLLKIEERGLDNGIDQYKIMDEAGISYPKQFRDPKDINTIVIVKVLEKERGFERANFLVKNYAEYQYKKTRGLKRGDFTKEQIRKAVIEEFILGVQVNFNFFYDPISERLELIGTDTRRQTNFEGIYRLSWPFQESYQKEGGRIHYEEASHVAVTVLESMLEQAFEIGEKFVKATQKLLVPGVIGPFGLQTMITPGPPKKEIVVFDVSPRMPGSPGISATPYSNYLFGQSLSMGRRVAIEIKEAIKKGQLNKITT